MSSLGESISVERLIGRLYEAAQEPELWQETIAAIADATGCRNGVLYEYDIPSRHSNFLAAHHLDPGFVNKYQDYVGAIDPWNQRMLGWPAGVVASTYALIGDDDLRRTDFYQEHLRPERIFYDIGGVVLRTSERMALFGVQCDHVDGRFSTETQETIATLMPHLGRAYRLHAALRDARLQSDTLLEAMYLLRQPVMIVDRQGMVVFANHAAEDLLKRADGIRLTAGRVAAAHRADRSAFKALLQGGGRIKLDRTTLNLRRPAGRRPLTVEAVPLSAGSDRVALMIGRTGDRASSPSDLMQRFGVTSAEARLWAALTSAATLGEIAERSQVSVNTLRVQLAALFRKLGVHRQTDLVRLALE
jgi:DNA-binding CsgD family transcriptional regulator